MNVSIAIVGADTEAFEATWNAETRLLTWTATGLPHEFLTIVVNDKTDYVVTANKQWHPNPDGFIFIPEHSGNQIEFFGDGAAPQNPLAPAAVSGFTVNLSNKSLTTCTLALRASLDLVNPSWETSEINLGFILPDATPETLQFIATTVDGAYISYSSWYSDTSDTTATRRIFTCTTKGITLNGGNEITLTGVDQSEKLSKNQAPRYFSFDQMEGIPRLYALFRSFITNAGIDDVTAEEDPPAATSGTSATRSVFLTERVYSSYILFYMRHLAVEAGLGGYAFWPRYVDAGRPTVTWSYPEAKWGISEEECGNIQWSYEPAIRKFSMDNDAAESPATRKDIETKEVKAGRKYWFDMQDPYRAFQCTNGTILYSNALRVKIQATATGNATLSGIPIEIYDNGLGQDTFTFGDYGQAITEDGEWYFENACANVDKDGGTRIDFAARADVYDHYQAGSITQTVTFTWKGDPRMQPLDIFIFSHPDGTSEAWTIGSITLDHTGGGLSAEITARRGIL